MAILAAISSLEAVKLHTGLDDNVLANYLERCKLSWLQDTSARFADRVGAVDVCQYDNLANKSPGRCSHSGLRQSAMPNCCASPILPRVAVCQRFPKPNS